MGGSRGSAILLILAVAWFRLALSEVKDHVAALNVTGHHRSALADSVENEVSFTSDELDQHPHAISGKPTKLDTNVNQMIQTDDKSQYQIEATRMENATASPLESTECQTTTTTKDLFDLLDRLSRIDTYNVSDTVQVVRNQDVIARKDEKGNDRPDATLLDKVRRYAREHVIKIRLSQDLIPDRKARTFFNGESTVTCSCHAFLISVCTSKAGCSAHHGYAASWFHVGMDCSVCLGSISIAFIARCLPARRESWSTPFSW